MKLTEVAAAVILREDGHYLLGQRGPGSFYPGYWEFPGGKVEPGETPRAALIRELHEELEIEVLAATPWIVREHLYEHAHVRLHFFRVTRWRGEFHDHVHAALAWQDPAAPTASPMLPANGPLLAALRLPAVYGITHAWQIGVAAQLATLDAPLARGLRLVQLRENALPEIERAAFGAAAVLRCRQHGARVLVNGDAELARAIDADGLHLPARQLMALNQRPPFPLVAASCHERQELEQAARLGLDFAVLGPLKPTATHPGDAGIGWGNFAGLIAGLPMPVYAIGGLSSADLPEALAAGAQGIAAIRAAWD
ncbi:MAG: Nudix family hydrolase [Rhodocyclaceae bacterium]|nr:Nudix family hydrolase [Rhodocyclaceae bacterium]MDP1956887.1 Nudix family hydrolase [Rhodocyclaceae bacterium]